MNECLSQAAAAAHKHTSSKPVIYVKQNNLVNRS